MFEGFSLRKWATNNPNLRDVIANHEHKTYPDEGTCERAIAEDDQTYATSSLGTNLTDSDGKNRMVLGLHWSENYADLFESDSSITKRKVLSVTSKIYDPLGLAAPVKIVIKTLFQLLCKDGLDWEQQPSNELHSKVVKWKNDLEECKTVEISRCFVESLTGDVKSVELLGFGDASVVA